MHAPSKPTGPRRLHPDAASRVKEWTIRVSRRAGLPFTTRCAEGGFDPHGIGEWDDLLVEFKCKRRPTKCQFEN